MRSDMCVGKLMAMIDILFGQDKWCTSRGVHTLQSVGVVLAPTLVVCRRGGIVLLLPTRELRTYTILGQWLRILHTESHIGSCTLHVTIYLVERASPGACGPSRVMLYVERPDLAPHRQIGTLHKETY